MSTRTWRRRRWRRGASLIEMMVVMLVLMTLSFGCVEYGYFIFVKQNLQSAAREGARAAILPGATAQTVTTVVQAAVKAARMDVGKVTCNITDPTSGKAVDVSKATAGTMLQVEVQTTWGAVGIHAMPLGGIKSDRVLKGATVMRKEG